MASKTNVIVWNESKLAIVALTSAAEHGISVGGKGDETTTVQLGVDAPTQGESGDLFQRVQSAEI
eukprot:COSAG06_NODE_1703_length_8656_cov_22.238051_4_plen_65_part_00